MGEVVYAQGPSRGWERFAMSQNRSAARMLASESRGAWWEPNEFRETTNGGGFVVSLDWSADSIVHANRPRLPKDRGTRMKSGKRFVKGSASAADASSLDLGTTWKIASQQCSALRVRN